MNLQVLSQGVRKVAFRDAVCVREFNLEEGTTEEYLDNIREAPGTHTPDDCTEEESDDKDYSDKGDEGDEGDNEYNWEDDFSENTDVDGLFDIVSCITVPGAWPPFLTSGPSGALNFPFSPPTSAPVPTPTPAPAPPAPTPVSAPISSPTSNSTLLCSPVIEDQEDYYGDCDSDTEQHDHDEHHFRSDKELYDTNEEHDEEIYDSDQEHCARDIDRLWDIFEEYRSHVLQHRQ